ncbi:SDR family NAD(P)-dependent oxidoreductase [Arthrobacter sp. ISL-28]|uniref:SDR family NAD(P)-dependent oxidoreductase n=1 Tax=Arthrobacter sp. ISL-28 TaxID=2819108 RepID=UPI001BE62EBE|nr:glucose 1-dehydrogenase [Arthrobacter sp. ISL-28]MBT2523320.1 glucose 1-dehydrogenase [Arthrobacter sp. ISL-28]
MNRDKLFDLSGRVAVVTGGSRGLGREIVRAYAAAGADVVIASRKINDCQALADQVTAEFGVSSLAVRCHVGHWDDVGQLAEQSYDRFGKVDVLVNNAGMSPHYSSLGEISEELYDKVFAVNLKGPFRLSALIGERMMAAGGGSIINISSASANLPTPEEVPYAAAKAGLNSLTQGMARSFAPLVRVNTIVAGPFLTDISAAWDMEAFERNAQTKIALRRAGDPGEIVGAALYLASDASSFTTSALINVDGGYR